jgi:hypothetical protein
MPKLPTSQRAVGIPPARSGGVCLGVLLAAGLVCGLRPRPTAGAEPDVFDVVPLRLAAGNVRVYFTARSYSHLPWSP